MSNDTELNFPMKRKREPKVIVFTEPGKDKTTKNQKRNDSHDDENELEFLNIAREVKSFGITGFTKTVQKKDKQKYAEYLGAPKQKSQKEPYPILMKRIK